MHEIILADFKFGNFLQNRQFTKLNTLPKFMVYSRIKLGFQYIYLCWGNAYTWRDTLAVYKFISLNIKAMVSIRRMLCPLKESPVELEGNNR